MKIRKAYLKSLIKQKSLKQREVALEIGVSPQDFNNWMFRGVFPHYDKLKEVAQLLEVPVGDLTTEKLFLDVDGSLNYKNYVVNLGIDAIPFYDLEAKSVLTLASHDLVEKDPSDYVHIPGLSADFVIPYFGSEMESEISGGDLIALRKVKDHTFFNYGHIYLIVTKEHAILRTVRKGKEKDHLKLSAKNSNTDDIEIPLDSIKSAFLLVSIIKRQVI